MTYHTAIRRAAPPKRRTLANIGLGSPWDDLLVQINSGDNTGLVDIATGAAVPATAAAPGDNVFQTASGTTTSAADFSSVGGVCKPSNFPALNVVRWFQEQLNRVAQVKGFSKVSPDGAVGPATLTLFRKVQAAAPAGSIMGDANSCMTVAPDVDVLGQQIQTYADSLGAPAKVSGPILSTSVPTIQTKSGQTVVAPDAGFLGQLATLSSVEKLALLGVGGGIAFVLWKRHRQRGRRVRR